MEKTLIIMNPAAKGEKALRFRKKLTEIVGDTEIRLTSFAGEAGKIAADAVAAGYTKIVAAGGDGTVNEVVNGVGESGVGLGIFPIGTMNVLAAELGLPIKDLAVCWQIIQEGRQRWIDLPRANDRYFVQLAGVGLDAQVVRETDLGFRKNFGPLSYVVSLAQIAARKPPLLTVHTPDGETREGSFVLVGNGRYYGGPFHVFGKAAIDDGYLDVLVFKDLGVLDIVRYTQSLLFGNLSKMADVDYFQTPSLKVTSEGTVPVQVDGEVLFDAPVEFSLAREKLSVFVPR